MTLPLKTKYFFAGLKTISSILMNKLLGYKTPLLAYILITNRCNLDCVYCFSNATKTENIDMPLEKIYSIVDQLKSCGTILITITGGEPSLHKDLDKIIHYILKKGMMVELVTNGLHFEKNLEAIKLVDFLAISIDGNEEHHDKNRGKGSFKVAEKALFLAKLNGIHTRIHASFTRKTAKALEGLMEISRQYNVRANIAIPSIHTNDPDLAFTDEEIRDYYYQMSEYKKRGYLISNSYSTLDFIRKWPGNFGYISERRDPRLPFVPCKRKEFNIYVDVDGFAYPCCSLWKKYHFNVFEQGLKTSFKNFKEVACTNCVIEAEFNLLFNGSLSSLVNIASFGLLDRINAKKIESL